jgi:hypothetical protein
MDLSCLSVAHLFKEGKMDINTLITLIEMNKGTIAIIAVLAIPAWLILSATTIGEIINIRRKPTIAIGDLPGAGRVEVVGMAGQKISESPLTKSPCVLWQLKVEEEKVSNKGNINWATVYDKTSNQPFEIYDETGRIQIQPDGADLILGEDASLDNLDAQATTALRSLGIETTNWLGSKKRMRVRERLISPEELVYVVGKIQQKDGSKSIACGGDRLVIADRGESDTLSTLYNRLAKNVGVVILGGIILIYFLIAYK